MTGVATFRWNVSMPPCCVYTCQNVALPETAHRAVPTAALIPQVKTHGGVFERP